MIEINKEKKVFAIVLREKINAFFVIGDMFIMGTFLSGKLNFLIVFKSNFVFGIFSDTFSCKSFLFLSLLKTYTVIFASLYSFFNFLSSLSRAAIFSAISP